MIYVIALALAIEMSVPMMAIEWSQYGALSEFRILFWMVLAFVGLKRIPVYYRAIILFLSLCQVWTFIVYFSFMFGFELSGHFIDAVSCAAVIVCLWLFLRDFERPSVAIRTSDIEKDSCYFIVRDPTDSYFKDVLLSFFGVPASSVSVYLAGSVYGFSKVSNRYEIKNHANINKPNRYALKLNVKDLDEAHIVLSDNIGRKYSFSKFNCVSVLNKFCELNGIKLNPLQRMIPGLFVAKLIKAMS